MSDPPKKLGSLKDRIAAFENKGSGPAPASAPVPRPKPASAASWKPKPPSPPDSPRASVEHADNKGGMSAADAKESITKGGSLKERMAALQGKGGFGGSPPPVAPKPAIEKPKWKPPPVIQHPVDDDDEDVAAPKPLVPSPPVTEEDQERDEVPKTTEHVEAEGATPIEGDAAEKEADPQEEERQRRTAIAARMARLGGARVGMAAPPIYGKKPDVKRMQSIMREEEPLKPYPPHAEVLEVTKDPEVQSTPGAKADAVLDHAILPAKADENPQDYFGTGTTTASPGLSAESPPTAVKTPSMPVPAAPRRAAPPRKKAGKSPSAATPQPVLDDDNTQSPAATPLLGDNVQAQDVVEAVQEDKEVEAVGSRSPELVGSVQAEALVRSEAPETEEQSPEEGPYFHDVDPHAHVVRGGQEADEQSTSALTPANVPSEQEDESAAPAAAVSREVEHEADSVKAEEEVAEVDEDDASRRKRISERLARSGGFNPLTGPPPTRKPSLPPASPQSEDLAPSMSPPGPERRHSQRRESTDSATHIPPPIRRSSVRQNSNDEPLRSPPPVTAPKPEGPVRRSSTSSVGSNVSSRRMSQDDRKSIVHESMHRPQSSISEDITEEPESQAADEVMNTGNEDAAAARDDHEGRRTSEDADRHDVSSKASPDRRVSYLHAEEEYDEQVDDHEQEYDLPVSNRVSSPTSAYEGDGVEVLESGADSVTHDSQSGPETQAERPSLPPPLSKWASNPPPRALPTTPNVVSGVEIPRNPSVSKKLVPLAPVIPPSEDLEDDEGHDSTVASTPALKSLKSPPPPSTGPLSPPPPVPSIPKTIDSATSALVKDDVSISEPRSPPVRKESMAIRDKPESVSSAPRPPAHTRPSVSLPVSSQDIEPAAPRRPTALPSRRDSLPKRSSPPTQRSILSPLSVPNESEGGAEQEVLGDEDGDPIDPSFHSPARSSVQASSPIALTVQPAPTPVVAPEIEGVEEQNRRRTIAERMNKLGGIRFGAPPSMPTRAPPPSKPEEGADNGEDGGFAGTESEDKVDSQELPQEEDEFARKQRIAARIAGMGGMRLGMIPSVISPEAIASPSAGRVPHIRGEEDGAGMDRSPSVTSKLLPPSTLQASYPDDSVGQPQSDEGAPLEAYESEAEQVSHDEEEQEEAAPPIPSRQTRRTSVPPASTPQRGPPVPPSFARPPPIPSGRPPIPSPTSGSSVSPSRGRRPTMETEEQLTSSYLTPMQLTVGPPSPNDYVMVEPESIEEIPPPPPSRSSRGAPPLRSIPPPAPPTDMSESIVQSSWELPQIPSSSLGFSGETDLSSSPGQWSDVPPPETPRVAQPPIDPQNALFEASRRQSSQSSSEPHTEVNLSADDLMAQWGRVGVQIHEVAATMYEKSKKSVVGDGTYAGFVAAVISQVPNASQPPLTYESFGYLIYSQVGSALQRRSSDIMPGDVIVLHEAKLKGHKGLQIYHQNVGIGEPVVAIVADHETKRSKVKVFQANLHVGQQSVESVSYRLEDVKSGTIKIYRVLEK